MTQRRNGSGMLSSRPPTHTLKAPDVSTSDDLAKIVQSILLSGGEITITIKAPEPESDQTTTAIKAKCTACGWQSARTYTSKKSADRALRAHLVHCKGESEGEIGLKNWIEHREQN